MSFFLPRVKIPLTPPLASAVRIVYLIYPRAVFFEEIKQSRSREPVSAVFFQKFFREKKFLEEEFLSDKVAESLRVAQFPVISNVIAVSRQGSYEIGKIKNSR